MDFGEILSKWEGSLANQSAKNNKKAMEEWLEKNEVYDKDADKKEETAPGETRRRLLRAEPDGIIDIHGLTSEKARNALDVFFTDAKNSNYKKLRIIHGKGNNSKGEAVLKKTVRKYIEKCPIAGESGYEKQLNGGTGATWVLIK